MKKTAFLLVTFLVILIVGGLLVFKTRFGQKEETGRPAPTSSSHLALPEKKENIDVTLTPRYDNKAVILKISKIAADVVSIDYELSYEAKGGLAKGVLGKVEVKGQETLLREILLGTCSRNVCVYDEGVKKISLTLKFNKPGGLSTGFSQDYEL